LNEEQLAASNVCLWKQMGMLYWTTLLT
jgi:hypothetical protein